MNMINGNLLLTKLLSGFSTISSGRYNFVQCIYVKDFYAQTLHRHCSWVCFFVELLFTCIVSLTHDHNAADACSTTSVLSGKTVCDSSSLVKQKPVG